MYLLALMILSCFMKSTIATEYALVTAIPGNGEEVQIDIALDKTTMLTYPGTPDPPQDCFEETINFHDFEKGLVAIKIVDKGKCVIKPTTETYEEVKKIVDDIHQGISEPIKQVTEEWGEANNPIPSDEVESTVGKKIANFCTGYQVYVLEDGKVVRSLPDLPWNYLRKRAGGTCWVCFGCSVSKR